MKCLQFGDGVVIGLAFSVTEPCEEAQRENDHTDADTEFRAFLHRIVPENPILTSLTLT